MNLRNKKIIGSCIKKARVNAGLTQLELSKRVNISRSYLADIEHGRYAPSSEKLLVLAKELQIDVNRILGEINKVEV